MSNRFACHAIHVRGRFPLQRLLISNPHGKSGREHKELIPVTKAEHISLTMDYFTKWPEAFATPDQEATTVAGILMDQFLTRFGMTIQLHSARAGPSGLQSSRSVARYCVSKVPDQAP